MAGADFDAPIGVSLRRRVLTSVGWVVASVVVLVSLLVAGGLIGQVLSSKPLPRGDSRSGDIIGAAISLLIAGLCSFWMVRTGVWLRVRGWGRRSGSRGRWSNTAVRADAYHSSFEGPRHEFGGGAGWRPRRSTPLSQMTAAEVRRAMWLVPMSVSMGALAAVARIAVAAIDEQMSLSLAGALTAVFTVWPIATVIGLRRRYRARLSELRDPITGSLSSADAPLPPLPARFRLWLFATPLLIGVALLLAAGATGNGDTCVAKGIATTAARDGICKRGANLFGGGVTYNVVDAGQTLSMPGYHVRLLGSSLAPIAVAGPNATAALYPDHQGVLVSFELEVTNDAARPLRLPITHVITALIPDAPGSAGATRWSPGTHLRSAPAPQLDALAPVPEGQSSVAWVSFVLPPSIEARLHARLADLDFYPADENHDYVGQIRLWKAAGPAGNAALRFAPEPASAP